MTKLTSKSPKKKNVGNFLRQILFRNRFFFTKNLYGRNANHQTKALTQRPNACSARSLRNNRVRAKAQSLHSDQTPIPLGRYVATELEQTRAPLVRHPNTIAYPEKFFESAQAIAAHSHLRWPVLSREWIRRQQARIARVDWESRLPVLLGPRKSRLSLLTRKQQKLLNKAREMEGVPDLRDANVEPSAQNPTKKAAGKAKKRIAEGEQSASLEEIVPLEETPFSAEASKVSKKKKKKKDGKKRPREDPSIDQNEASTVVREDNTGGPAQAGSTEASPEERPKKRAKKKSVEEGARRSVDGDHPDNLPASEDPSRSGGKASGSNGDPRSESPSSERAVPTSATRKGVQSEGSLSKRARVKFPDRVDFMYDEKTPLVFNPLQCAELTRQFRGGTRELPPIGDLYFKDKYIDAAFTRKRVTYLPFSLVQTGPSRKLKKIILARREV
ncbi:hypothetical protein F2Q70_00022485 [Brassica cretica]|uniref:Uncharacterized protein n=1 Tax=Brassica cretica TaxID=69181 RepID=A0A8S9GQU6_BRACR|nr:hypothetical protein F2Q70_00022485 [Brassica cretica]